MNELNESKNGKSSLPQRDLLLCAFDSFTPRFASSSGKALQQINAAAYDFVHIDTRMWNFHALIAMLANLRNNSSL